MAAVRWVVNFVLELNHNGEHSTLVVVLSAAEEELLSGKTLLLIFGRPPTYDGMVRSEADDRFYCRWSIRFPVAEAEQFFRTIQGYLTNRVALWEMELKTMEGPRLKEKRKIAEACFSWLEIPGATVQHEPLDSRFRNRSLLPFPGENLDLSVPDFEWRPGDGNHWVRGGLPFDG